MQSLPPLFADSAFGAVLGLTTSLVIAAIGPIIVAIVIVTLVRENRNDDSGEHENGSEPSDRAGPTEHLDDEVVQ